MFYDIYGLFIERYAFFLRLLYEHMAISLSAIGIAILLGGLTGILISECNSSARPALGIINFLYTIPSISMLGFLIPFSGVGNTTAVIALTIYALLPMVRNTYTGIRHVEAVLIEAAKGMGSTRLQILVRIKIPLALPVIMAGIRSMTVMTVALAGIASFIGAGGLGVAIYRGITTNNAAMTLTGSLLIAALALVMDGLLGFVELRLQKRSKKARRTNRLLAMAACAVCLITAGTALIHSHTQDRIRLATKPMTEQYILGEALKALIEQQTNLRVDLTQGVGGGTSNIQPAMEKGSFDLYPEYTGTGWNMVLKEEGLYTEDLFDTLQDEYNSRLNMSWMGMFGFNNTYGLAVRREIAEQYGLKTYSDLQAVASRLIFGAEYDFFEREDGYDALCNTYGLYFKETMDLDIGLKYRALSQKRIDVMVVFTTDGQLAAADAVVLEDDKGFYPSYRCGMVVRNGTISTHPELESVLNLLADSISDSDMARMNYAVETEGREPRAVAEEFLRSRSLLK